MTDPHNETTAQLTVRVVAGCLTCRYYSAAETKQPDDPPDWRDSYPAVCDHNSAPSNSWDDDSTPIMRLSDNIKQGGDKLPPECPLRLKEGERLEIVVAT